MRIDNEYPRPMVGRRRIMCGTQGTSGKTQLPVTSEWIHGLCGSGLILPQSCKEFSGARLPACPCRRSAYAAPCEH